jgi:Holliday junction DNA helicase RuvA
MISSVRGRLEYQNTNGVVIAIGGFSLRIQVPLSVIDTLGAPGESVELFTSLQMRMREDTIALYGFTTNQARRFFELLIGITGVGPRNALALLSAYSPVQLAAAITSGRSEVLSSVSGVGKRLADRIIVDLRGKLESEWGESTDFIASDDSEVIAALVALGYSPTEARSASSVTIGDGNLSLEERVRAALQAFGKRDKT